MSVCVSAPSLHARTPVRFASVFAASLDTEAISHSVPSALLLQVLNLALLVRALVFHFWFLSWQFVLQSSLGLLLFLSQWVAAVPLQPVCSVAFQLPVMH